MNENFRQRLLEMVSEDARVRKELAESGELFDGYNEKMEAVHLKNAAELEKMIEETNGEWLGISLVGNDGAEAAWLIVQHAISLPDFSRKCLALIERAVQKNEAEARHFAYLQDRINFFERKPQRFGTQSDWNSDGMMQVWFLEDESKVNNFRAEVGLKPLDSFVWGNKETAENAPKNYAERQATFENWLKKVGWRK